MVGSVLNLARNTKSQPRAHLSPSQGKGVVTTLLFSKEEKSMNPIWKSWVVDGYLNEQGTPSTTEEHKKVLE